MIDNVIVAKVVSKVFSLEKYAFLTCFIWSTFLICISQTKDVFKHLFLSI
jgi:hypothetical protein